MTTNFEWYAETSLPSGWRTSTRDVVEEVTPDRRLCLQNQLIFFLIIFVGRVEIITFSRPLSA